ncbi:MAG: quercetin dioxygenase-like cupin family protein [Bacteroidia bacterium]|jgi:quercetin dioxygenase-like cupin family protein
METGSFLQNINFDTERPKIDVILETPFSKEIRIAMVKDQLMKDHSAPLPIVVSVLKGQIDFGTESGQVLLNPGDIISVEPSVRHNLLALEESVVRLTLAKGDSADRVKAAAKK